MGNLDDALNDANTIPNIPPSAKTLTIFGRIYLKMKNYDKAEGYFKQAINCDSLYSDAYNNLGYAKGLRNNFDSAKIYIDKALKKDSLNASSYNNLGYIYEIKKDYNKALQCYNKSLQINPYQGSTHFNRASLIYNHFIKKDACEDLIFINKYGSEVQKIKITNYMKTCG
jgi:tetratricopeptide (TPR) repeat protein